MDYDKLIARWRSLANRWENGEQLLLDGTIKIEDELRVAATAIETLLVPGESTIDRLAAIEDILGNDYDLDRLRELTQADREGRCVVLPIKVPGWGWCCNREYPNAISAYFAYPSQVVGCMEEYILRESKDEAEAALRREQE